MKFFKHTLIFLLLAHFSFSQGAGESTYQFLNLISSPRQAALGGRVSTNYDYDVSNGLLNPATINSESNNSYAFNYVSHLAGIGYGNATGTFAVGERKRIFQLGFVFVNSGDIDGYDLYGNPTSSFNASEMALSIGHSYEIPNSNVKLGASLKFINSRLENYVSTGGALDLSVVYFNPKSKFMTTFLVRNLGTQFKSYNDVRETLPLEVSLGFAKTLENMPLRWHVTFQNLQQWPIAFSNPSRGSTDLDGNTTQESVNFLDELVRRTIIGFELFPDKGLNFRFGYNFRRGQELNLTEVRSFSGLSFGFGLKIKKLRFSYTNAKYSIVSNTNLFGIQLSL